MKIKRKKFSQTMKVKSILKYVNLNVHSKYIRFTINSSEIALVLLFEQFQNFKFF